jgi:thiol:disulfide interchange protein DsbC
MNFLLTTLLSITLLTSTLAVSAETANTEKLKQALAKKMPKVKTTKISESPIAGLYEVVIGSQVIYMSIDARYIIEGDLIDIDENKNISDTAKSSIRLGVIDTLGEKNMVVYKPKKTKSVITVVTDIDCPYCRKLHSEVPEYLKNNVAVRYIFMPLKGKDDVEKTISVWCSDNQQEALDKAKAGKEITKKTCDNPIQKHMRASQDLGIRGTPAIIFENGEMIPGYVPVAKVIAKLEKMKK